MEDNFRSSYVPLDVAASINEWSDGVQGGETCWIEAMKDVFAWMRGSINGWYGWANDGKAIHILEDIATPDGFKKMRDIIPGDIVFDEIGNQCSVLRVTGIQNNKKCFRLTFNDGSVIECCEDHLWLTFNSSEIGSFYRTKKRIIKRTNYDQSFKRKFPQIRTTDEISRTLIGKGGRNNHAIPLARPIFCQEKKLRIHPYLLGTWLGDGISAQPVIVNHLQDYEIIENIINAGYFVRRLKQWNVGRTYNYHIGKRGEVRFALKSYDLLNNKRIPKSFLFSSYDQRLALLQGLMDTDGYINDVGMCEYCTIIEKFATDVRTLLSSLGIRASINVSEAKLYGRKTSMRYRIFFKTTLPVFRLERKANRLPKKVDPNQGFRFIIKCEPIESVPVKCIEVDSPSHLYLAGRSLIPTHNTEFRDFLKVLKAKRDGWKFCCFKPEDMNSVMVGGKATIKANRIYKNLAWNLTGKTWNENFSKKYFVPRMTLEEENEALDFITSHIYVVYPKDRNYKNIIDEFRFMQEKYGITGFEIDTFSGLLVPGEKGERDDEKMVRCFFDFKQFALETNTIVDFVAHAKAQSDAKEKNGSFKVVNQFMILGGSAWDAKMDGQYSIYRPERHLSPSDPKVHFWNLKQKESQIVGVQRGVYEKIEFSFTKKQYYFDGVNPLTGEVKLKPGEKPKEKVMDFTEPKAKDDGTACPF